MLKTALSLRRRVLIVLFVCAALGPIGLQAAVQDRVDEQTLSALRGPLAAGARLNITRFPLNGMPRTLELERFEVWAPNAEIVAEGDGVRKRLPIPTTRFFRGRVAGQAESMVFLSVGDGVSGLITSGDQRFEVHSNVRKLARGANSETETYVDEIADVDDTEPGFMCANEGKLMNAAALQASLHKQTEALGSLTPVTNGGALGTSTATRTILVALEADSDLFTNLGSSTTNVNTFIGNLVGAATTIYVRDLRTDIQVSFQRIQTSSASDPFLKVMNPPVSGTWNGMLVQYDGTHALAQLGDIWHNSAPSAAPRTAVVRLSGGSSGQGIAWMNLLAAGDTLASSAYGEPFVGHYVGAYAYCGGLTTAFGLTTTMPDPNQTSGGVQYSASGSNYWQLLEFAHELGHIVNSDHTHCVALTSTDKATYGVTRSYVDICYSGESGCYSGSTAVPVEKGTIMSYCHLNGGGSQTRYIFGKAGEASEKMLAPLLAGVTGTRMPDAPSMSAPASIGAGATLSASVTAIAGQSYLWSITNGTIVGSNTGSTVNFTGSANPVTLRVRTTKNASTTTSGGTTAGAASDYRTITYNACVAPSISAQPQSVAITTGGTATLTVSASGAVSYQWYIGAAGTTTTPTGTNSSSLAVTPAVNTNYWVRVTGSCGTVDSQAATVSIVPPSTTPSGFYIVTPCRIIDTRDPVGAYGGPAPAAGVIRAVQVTGKCAIPATAKAVAINLTAVGPSAAGWFTLYPGGALLPSTSTMNYRAGKTRANNAIVNLSGTGILNVYNSGPSTVNFIIDVNGYFQ